MKKIWILAAFVCVSLLFSQCKNKSSDPMKGAITFVKGTVSIQRGDQKIAAAVAQEIQNGDVLITGPKSVVTIVFGENSSVIEIQSDSQFRLKQESNETVFFQDRGSSWLLSNKLLKGDKLSVHTPTTTAGVRGTKFFTAIHEDMTFTCHCEGQIELENIVNHSKKVNESDYLAVTRGSKTIYLTPEDLQGANIAYSHNHSEIEKSPVGAQSQMTPTQVQTLLGLIKKKLDAP
ncbi:iron dicitrate transport regulator FecR [Leptospira tipperaryensis]|uniref:Iron dicitrate transport regulator FecR n=1 Tax=Leptospira tipperaryensis TaxID=2564040 RepID=A0A1D7V398_9LEPT|nr:FecR family protein [Leptospira tipperaryensis]AOP36325.1 iron dicitrate transport regulator FecR [Leptospira tipperaryensis]